mgnify:CR=1 FL=1
MAVADTQLLTGWAALPALREADRLVIAGDVAARDALLLTIDQSIWNGSEIVTGGSR